MGLSAGTCTAHSWPHNGLTLPISWKVIPSCNAMQMPVHWATASVRVASVHFITQNGPVQTGEWCQQMSGRHIAHTKCTQLSAHCLVVDTAADAAVWHCQLDGVSQMAIPKTGLKCTHNEPAQRQTRMVANREHACPFAIRRKSHSFTGW